MDTLTFHTDPGRYVQQRGVRCPFCGSDDLDTVGRLQSDAGYAWQGVECANCGGKWADSYTLSGLEVKTEPEGSLKRPAEKGYPMARTASESEKAAAPLTCDSGDPSTWRWHVTDPRISPVDIELAVGYSAYGPTPQAAALKVIRMFQCGHGKTNPIRWMRGMWIRSAGYQYDKNAKHWCRVEQVYRIEIERGEIVLTPPSHHFPLNFNP